MPCSGEGTLRSSPKTFLMWNEKVVESLSRQQKKLLANALYCLKIGGSLVYSTCTHAPEENEEVIQYLLNHYKDKIKIESITLPIKSRPGITEWKGKKFSEDIKKCNRLYHHDNDMEGFFVCKIKKLK